jgi:hypothetical protein
MRDAATPSFQESKERMLEALKSAPRKPSKRSERSTALAKPTKMAKSIARREA